MSKPGFCGLKNPGSAPNSPMTTDRNADLIGHTFPVDTGGVGVVLGSWALDPTYVDVQTDAGLTLRRADQVRRAKELA